MADASLRVASSRNVENTEERKKTLKNLIDSIPTKKEELFQYVVDWDQVDQAMMKNKIHPWVAKKIVEYIGEDEPTLVAFICSRLSERTTAT